MCKQLEIVMLNRKSVSTLTGSCFVAALAALQAPAASAIPIDITSILSSWTAATPTGDISGVGTNTISWGVPTTTGGSQSSYTFAPAATPIPGLLPDNPFLLGEFTHNNFPIFAPSLLTAELTVDIEFDVLDGLGAVIDTRMISSVFDFTHFETPNSDDPCADGGANGVFPNQNGCADRVTFETSTSSEFFELDGIAYIFELTGFCADCPESGGEPSLVDEFWTVETEENSAVLVAQYTVREIPTDLPTPGAAWLLLAGLAGVAGSRQRARATIRQD
jgi:hypothetical protein